MGLFKNNKRLENEYDDSIVEKKVEIVAHQKATSEQIENVKEANDALNKLFMKNNFSLTIYLATSGKDVQQMQTKVGDETPKKWKRTN